jgi:hypothetical protein
MNIRNVVSISVLVAMIGIYVFFFTDWFKPKKIEIFHTSRSTATLRLGPRVKAGNENTRVIQFGLNGSYQLTEIKVVPLEQWKTNPSVLPVWHLITDSNSIPIKGFPYGQAIRGMKPAVGTQWPKPLETNVTYRMFITAGSLKGQHDFVPVPRPADEKTPAAKR